MYSDYEFIDADGTAFKRVDNPDPADPVELLLRLHDRLGEPDNFVPFGHARLYRSKALRLHGGFNNSFRYAEDFELLLRLAARGCQFAHVPQRLYRYRWHGGKGIVNRPAQIDEVKRAVRELVGERR